MVTLFAIFQHPGLGDLARIVECAQQLGIEHIVLGPAVESLDIGVLVGLAKFEVVDHYTLSTALVGKGIAHKFRAVIGAQHLRHASLGFDLLENAHQALGR